MYKKRTLLDGIEESKAKKLADSFPDEQLSQAMLLVAITAYIEGFTLAKENIPETEQEVLDFCFDMLKVVQQLESGVQCTE